MENPRFKRIVQEICVLANIANWHELAQNGLLNIDGVSMQIQVAGTKEGEYILAHIDFSDLPSERTSDFLRMLLDLNFIASVSNTRFFSTNPQKNRVIAFRRILLTDRLDGETVIKILREEARVARSWQYDWPPTASSPTSPTLAAFLA